MTMKKSRRRYPRSYVLCSAIVAVAGCSGDSVTRISAPGIPADALAFINASPPASIIAVGGTQQVTVSGGDYSGDAITTFDSVVYQLNTRADSTRVRVSSDGLLTHLATGSGNVLINVIAFKGRAIRGDQIAV